MVIGGTCAKALACPKGTKLGAKGLCPAQQTQGIECCSPRSLELKCKSRGGACVSTKNKCPKTMVIKEATDCTKNQVCCAYVAQMCRFDPTQA
ncbi:uncharacterized protein LOC113492986 isoform X2 [Trichoplusia ni]|nr:uncharacterized protein LOC113492986 isoform X2 [Trichoplusia ni]